MSIRLNAVKYQLSLYKKLCDSLVRLAYCHHCSEPLLYLAGKTEDAVTCASCLHEITPEDCSDIFYEGMEQNDFYRLSITEKIMLIDCRVKNYIDKDFVIPESSQLREKGYLNDKGELTDEGVLEADDLIKKIGNHDN